MDSILVEKCLNAAKEMRKDVLRMSLKAGNAGAHIGGSLSMIEIMAVLYLAVLKLNPADPLWEGRDRFILSKGHCVLAQYAALKQRGILTENDLRTFEEPDSSLCSHATLCPEKGIEVSTGSLGQGLSMGIGMALSLKRKQNKEARVFVLLGDGECDEGSVWEAAMAAAHFNLNNLVAIVDKNEMQLDGKTHEVMGLGNLKEKWTAFGWNAVERDGHNIAALNEALDTSTDRPLALIAHTIKGKGVSFMENLAQWHHGRLGQKQFDLAMAELEGAL